MNNNIPGGAIIHTFVYRYIHTCISIVYTCFNIFAATIEVCIGENRTIRCHRDEIIMMTSAEYGRKEVGRCIPEVDDFIGCTNDVLPLLDRWCSGRRECAFGIPDAEIESFNKECLKILIKYLKVEYTCLKGNVRRNLPQTFSLIRSIGL